VLARAQARVRRKGSGRVAERGHEQRQSGRPAGRKNRGEVGHWKKEERGKEALTHGATWPERERGKRRTTRSGWEKAPTSGAQLAEGERRARGVAGLREKVGRAWPMRKEEGRGGEKARPGQGGGVGCLLLFFLLPFSFSIL
jgi:hypothetical protein